LGQGRIEALVVSGGVRAKLRNQAEISASQPGATLDLIAIVVGRIARPPQFNDVIVPPAESK
jgi:hypothetical protein